METSAQIGRMEGASAVMQGQGGQQADHGCAADGAEARRDC